MEYEKFIGEWEGVLAWSRNHNDDTYVELAETKIQSLRSRIKTPKLMPLEYGDRFFDRYKLPTINIDQFIKKPNDFSNTGVSTNFEQV